MSTRRGCSISSVLLVLSVAACGGSTAPPSDVTTTPSAAPPPAGSAEAPPSTAPTPGAEPAAPSASAAAEPPKTETAEAAPSAEPGPTRSVGDRLFARTIAYMLNYSASPAKEKVTAACAAKSSDPALQAACVEKERAKLVSDVLVFDKGEKGATWTIYKRAGNQLQELASAQIDVGADSPEKMEFKIKNEKGMRQLFAGKKQVTVLSESDSSVALDDPQFGKLVYEARIGLVESK